MATTQWTCKLTLIVVLALGGCSGGIPANTGQNGSTLAPCPASPNCVSSLASAESQRVAALPYSGDAAQAQSRLLGVLKGMERVHIVRVEEAYIHAEFRSALLGFVDDVEFLFDPPGTIQIRSASRLGYSDFGVNRERVTAIHALFAASAKANS
ncbi:MAG: DUF1499 domain-containing protein [Propionivibrio sp.]|uniref:DUF1499 domain-containing protein n=1 Tax=Propionivibrio sp. TaxID=2212460 RepID=UPI001A4B7090|nr:DUF1499 domain-containing protein [Propionivibrio sp.]MBL8413756.1 DUF1499 domain-containing protein [Propionivibrio sp.]